jgi:hypothetical protein
MIMVPEVPRLGYLRYHDHGTLPKVAMMRAYNGRSRATRRTK